MGEPSPDPLAFLGRRLPPSFSVRVVRLEPGDEHPYDDTEWADSLVVLEAGAIEVECHHGGSRAFGAGDILWLTRLGLRAIHNRGDEPAVLVAVARRGKDSDR